MKKLAVCMGCALLVSVLPPEAQADSGDLEFGVKAGTLGAGAEIGLGLNEYLGIRAGLNYWQFSFDSTISDVDYEMDAELKTGSVMVDLYPFAGSFRLTAGLFINDNNIDLSGSPRSDTWLGDYSLPSAYSGYRDSVGINGSVEFNTLAPYVGIGWNSNAAGKAGLGVAFDMGILYQGSPKVSDLSASAPAPLDGFASHPAVTQALQTEKQAIEDDLDEYEFYPVVTLTLNYIF